MKIHDEKFDCVGDLVEAVEDAIGPCEIRGTSVREIVLETLSLLLFSRFHHCHNCTSFTE